MVNGLAEIAEHALERAGEDTLVTARRARSLRVDTRDGTRRAGLRSDETRLEVLCTREGQAARATTTDLSPDAVDAVLVAAAGIAETLARTFGPGGHPGIPEPGPARAHEGYDPLTARHELPELEGLDEGAFESRSIELAYASSRGLRASERATVAELEVRSGPAVARSAAVAVAGIDIPGVISRGAAHQELPPVSAVTGEVPAVLRAAAVADVLEVLGRTAFNGALHAEGRGALAGRLGKRVAAPSINLSDSPRFSSTLPRSYDAEGVAKSPIPLIQDGVAHRVVHDLTSAALAGGAAVSTGHGAGAVAGPAPRNLVLVGGGVAGEPELVAPVEHGVLVAGFEGVTITDPRNASFTARLAPGSCAIEGGRVVGLLDAAVVSASALELLGTVEALSATPELVLSASSDPTTYPHGTVCPALRLSSLRLL